MNISTMPPIWASSMKGVGGKRAAEKLKVKKVEGAGAGDDAYRQFSDDRRNAEAGAKRGNHLRGGKQNGDKQSELESCRHQQPLSRAAPETARRTAEG